MHFDQIEPRMKHGSDSFPLPIRVSSVFHPWLRFACSIDLWHEDHRFRTGGKAQNQAATQRTPLPAQTVIGLTIPSLPRLVPNSIRG